MHNNEQETITSKKITLFTIIIVLFIGSLFGYKYYTSTPEYSLKIVAESIRKNDLNTFNKFVALHNITEDLYTDLMYYEIEHNTLPNSIERQMTLDYLKETRESKVSELENDFLKNFKRDNSSTQNNSSKGTLTDLFIKNTQSSIIYNGVKSKEFLDKNVCIITLDLYDKDIRDNLYLKLRMTKLDNGKWRIVKLENILDIYKKIPK